MKFSFFHLMPYPYLPDDFDERYDSPSLTYPNANFDPELGHELYHRYLDELEYADELGFDGIAVNEHHQTAYGLMPSPNLMAAALARRTTQAQDHGARQRDRHPRQPAAGRRGDRDARPHLRRADRSPGFVRGIGWEYFAHSINPTQVARARSTRRTT